MPLISSFYGIIIRMYFQQSEHNPPHIHAIYGDHIAVIDIQTQQLLDGSLPRKALAMVQEWTKDNASELLAMWQTQEFKQLPPLE